MILFLKVNRGRVYHVAVVDRVQLLIVLKKQALRIYSAMLDHVLGSRIVLVEVSEVVIDLYGVLGSCSLDGGHGGNVAVTVTRRSSDRVSFLGTQIVINDQIL